MGLRFRILGAVILACGLAACYGALQLWPTAATGSLLTFAVAVLRIAAAAVVSVIGILNVLTGAVVLLRPARD